MMCMLIDDSYQAIRVLNNKRYGKPNSYARRSGFMRPVDFLINTKKTTQTGWMKCFCVLIEL